MRRGVRPAGIAMARSGLAVRRSRNSVAAASASSAASRKTTTFILGRDDFVGRRHLLGEDLRRDELRVHGLEVLLRDPTGHRAAASDPDGHSVLDDLADHLGEGWHADRLHGHRDGLLHEIGGLAGDEDLRLVARLDRAEREVEGEAGARRVVGARSPHVQDPGHVLPPSRVRRGSGAILAPGRLRGDRKSTRLNSSHGYISYAVFCLKKKKKKYKIVK